MALVERYVSALAAGGGDGTVGTPWTLAEAAAAAVASDRVNIKADGIYTLAADFVPSNGGTTAAGIFWRGYKTTITDGYQGHNTDGTLVATNFPTIACGSSFKISNPAYYGHQFICLNITGSKASDYVLTDGGGGGVILFCIITHSGNNGYAVELAGAGARILYSEINSTLYGVYLTAAGNACIGCRVSASAAGGAGILLGQASYLQAINNVIFDCGAHGISLANFSSYALVLGNTIVNCVGSGIDKYSGVSELFEAENIITGCGVGRSLGVSIVCWKSVFDRTRDNGADTGTGDWPIYSEITTDTGGDETDYVDAVGGDFRLIVASPATRAGAFGVNNIGALCELAVTLNFVISSEGGNWNDTDVIAANLLVGAAAGVGDSIVGTAIEETHTVNEVVHSAGGNFIDENLTNAKILSGTVWGLAQTGALVGTSPSPIPTSLSVFPDRENNFWQVTVSGVSQSAITYVYEHGTDVLLDTINSSSGPSPEATGLGGKYVYCKSKDGAFGVSDRFPTVTGVLVEALTNADPGYEDNTSRGDLKPGDAWSASLLGFNSPRLNTLRREGQQTVTGNMTGEPL
jgi:hypothetical protein